ncbi:hypothetical protein, partial [Trichothermofontia sp.]
MPCILPLPLSRRCLSHLLLGATLLLSPVPRPTIAAEEPSATASPPTAHDRRSAIRSDAPSRPNPLP